MRTPCACAFVGRKSCACWVPKGPENTRLGAGMGNAPVAVMRVVLAMVLAGLVPMPLSVNAQAGEEGADAKPGLRLCLSPST